MDAASHPAPTAASADLAAELVEPSPDGRGDVPSLEGVLHEVEEVVVPTELGEVSEGEVDGPSHGPGEAKGDELGALAVKA